MRGRPLPQGRRVEQRLGVHGGGVPSHPCPHRPDELQLPQGEWGEGRGSPSGVLPITLEMGIFISPPTPFPYNKA